MLSGTRSFGSLLLQKYLLLSYLLCEDVVIGRLFAHGMQILSCLFNISVLFSLGGDKTGYFYENIQAHISVIQPLYWIRKTQIPFLLLAFLTMALILCGSLLTLVLLTYHRSLRDQKNHYQNVYFPSLGLIRLTLQVWGLLLFSPLCQIYIMSFHCISIKGKDNAMEGLLGRELCEGVNPGSFTICMIGFIGFWMLTFLSVFQQNFNFSNVNFLSRSPNYYEALNTSYKTLIIVAQFIHLLRENSLLIYTLCLIVQILLIAFIWRKAVYYIPSMEKLTFQALMLELWISVFFILLYLYRRLSIDIMTAPAFVISIIFMLKLSSRIITLRLEEYLSACGNSLTSEPGDHIERRIILMYAFIICQPVSDVSTQRIEFDINRMSLRVRGAIALHIDRCKNKDCFCKGENRKLYDYNLKSEFHVKRDQPSKNIENLIYLKYFVRSEFQNAREKSPEAFSHSASLRIAYCQFMFYQLRNFHIALVEAFEIQKRFGDSLSILQQLQLFRLLLDIDKLLYNLNRNAEKDPELSNLNIKLLVKVDENCKALEQKINVLIKDYQNFYESLMASLVRVEDLSRKSQRLLKIRQEVDNLFEENQNNPRSLSLYIDYLTNIIFHDERAYKLQKILKEKNEELNALKAENRLATDVQMMYNDRTLLVEMNGDSKGIGRITKINQNALKYLRYQEHEILTNNINILLPMRHRQFHDGFLHEYMNSGKGNVIFMERRLFARRQKGYIFQMQLLIKPFFEQHRNEFKFLGNLQPLGSYNEIIITDRTGAIDAISERLGGLLGLMPADFEEKRIFLQYLCPRLVNFFSEVMKQDRKGRPEISEFDIGNLYEGPRNFNQDMVLKVYHTAERGLSDVREQAEMMIEHSIRGNFDPSRFVFLKKKYLKLAILGNSLTIVCTPSSFISSNGKLKFIKFIVKEIERPKRRLSKSLTRRDPEAPQISENSFESPVIDNENPYNAHRESNMGQSFYYPSSTMGPNYGTTSFVSNNTIAVEKQLSTDRELNKTETNKEASEEQSRKVADSGRRNSLEEKIIEFAPLIEDNAGGLRKESKHTSSGQIIISEEVLASKANNIKLTLSMTPADGGEQRGLPLDSDVDRAGSMAEGELLGKMNVPNETLTVRKHLDTRIDRNLRVNSESNLEEADNKSMREVQLFKKGGEMRRLATSYMREIEHPRPDMHQQRKSMLQGIDPQTLSTLARDWGRLGSNISNMSSVRSPVERKVTMLFQKSPFSGKNELGFGEISDNIVKNEEASSTGSTTKRKGEFVNELDRGGVGVVKQKKKKKKEVKIQAESNASHSTRRGVRFGKDVGDLKKGEPRKTLKPTGTIAPTEKGGFFSLMKKALDTQIKVPENIRRDILVYEQSVRSSVSSVYQQQRGLEGSIRCAYLPPCYRHLITSFILTTLIMVACQIVITVILSG